MGEPQGRKQQPAFYRAAVYIAFKFLFEEKFFDFYGYTPSYMSPGTTRDMMLDYAHKVFKTVTRDNEDEKLEFMRFMGQFFDIVDELSDQYDDGDTKPAAPEKKPADTKPRGPVDDDDWGDDDEAVQLSAEQLKRFLASMNLKPESSTDTKKPGQTVAKVDILGIGNSNDNVDEDDDEDTVVIPGIGRVTLEELSRLHDILLNEGGEFGDEDYDYDGEATIPGEYDGVRAKKLRNK